MYYAPTFLQESSQALIKYVNVGQDSSSCGMFTFAHIWMINDAVDRLLLRTQCTIIHQWIELFKNTALARMQRKAAQHLETLDAANDVMWLRRKCKKDQISRKTVNCKL